MRHILTALLGITPLITTAQLTDDFSDGDFTSSPTWSGTTADYIVNASNELQLNNTIAGTSHLSTPHLLTDLNNKEWRFWTRQAFSPSGSNYGRVYLTSSSADLTTDPDGFYLQLGEGGSLDAVRLFKAESGIHTELLAGTASQIASSFSMGIRVIRDGTGNWSLYVDPNGGTAYTLEGTATDATLLTGTHFGMLNVYTASNATDFYYDTIYVGNEILDTDPPELVSATAIHANLVDLLFHEAVDQTTAETTGNYTLNPSAAIASATRDAGDQSLVHLALSTPLINGQTYEVTAVNIEDLAGNAMGIDSVQFGYFIAEQPAAGDVIIHEFLCDPTPQVGLAEQEFVEIYNRSNKVFNVADWKLGDASSAGTITNAWLLPGDHMILTSTSGVDSFTVAVGVTSFPGLNNSGDNIVLRDSSGLVLDSISYTNDWYGDDNKDDGGYTIERINPNDPCSDETNWAASHDPLGGTPGSQNSIYDDSPDVTPPSIDQLVALAPDFLQIRYSEGMDSTSLADATISVSPVLTIQNNYVPGNGTTSHTLEFVENLAGSQPYAIQIQGVADCWLNSADLSGVFVLPETPEVGDVIINEILFNPVTGGHDWVEVYNASEKLIDLNLWEVANFDNDTIDNHATVSEHFNIYPGEYAVLGEDTTQIIQQYPAAIPGRFIEMDLPAWSNDSSTVYLIYQGSVIDNVSYSDDWHFRLLDSDDGVSLERLDPMDDSQSSHNWHSAAEAIGFGTPGGKNSQFYPAVFTGDFSYTSETVSPDNNGFEDVLQINYEMLGPGFLGTFKVYDDRGRSIATVMDAELLGVNGTFTWDGVRDDNTKATIGTYVGVFEAVNITTGSTFAKRLAFVVAGNI